MMQTMIECGLDVEAQHHEVATAGQREIDLKFQTSCRWRRDVHVQVHHQERRQEVQQTVTFMPKPLFSGQRLWHAHPHLGSGRAASPCSPAAASPDSGDEACSRIGGILKHAPRARFLLPHHQQLQAVGAGYEAPVNLAYSQRNRSGLLPHPDVQPEPQGQADRVPLFPTRAPIRTLAFAALMMAALEGCRTRSSRRAAG